MEIGDMRWNEGNETGEVKVRAERNKTEWMNRGEGEEKGERKEDREIGN